jgi:hypothetical protein
MDLDRKGGRQRTKVRKRAPASSAASGAKNLIEEEFDVTVLAAGVSAGAGEGGGRVVSSRVVSSAPRPGLTGPLLLSYLPCIDGHQFIQQSN